MCKGIGSEIVLYASVVRPDIVAHALYGISAVHSRKGFALIILIPVISAEKVGDSLLLPGVIDLPMNAGIEVGSVSELLDNV